MKEQPRFFIIEGGNNPTLSGMLPFAETPLACLYREALRDYYLVQESESAQAKVDVQRMMELRMARIPLLELGDLDAYCKRLKDSASNIPDSLEHPQGA